MANKTNTNTIINNTTIKEETIMMKRMNEVSTQLKDNQKIQDANYIKKSDLRDILSNDFNLCFDKKATRAEMVEAFFDMYENANRTVNKTECSNVTTASSIPVGDLDITHDNTPAVEIDVFNNQNISDVMFRIMNETILNRNNTFVSNYIILSCVRKVLYGKYSTKTDKYGRYTKEKNTFTPEQDATTKSFIDKLIEKYKYTEENNGYTIRNNYHLQPVYQWQDAKYQIKYNKKIIIKTSPAGTQEFSLTRDHIGLINQYGTLVGFTR